MPELPWSLLAQPDQVTCGATSLVVARMLGDPAYTARIEGTDVRASGPAVAGPAAAPDQVRARFRTEALAMHRSVTGIAVAGQVQLPWPRAFGTPPWAVANQLSGTPAPDGTVTRYWWHRARGGAAASYDRLLAAARAGRVSAVYVGNTWLPRHVALVVDATATGALHVFDPARGRLDDLDRAAYVGDRIGIAGWDVAWFDVTPDR